METLRLGRTNITASRSGFGALPIQRIGTDDAVKLLKKAYDGGIDFYDTARGYTDSEEKIGRALTNVRKNIFIASKSMAPDKASLLKDIQTSLKNLKTDVIDIYQLHYCSSVDYDDPESPYQALLEARARGYIRFIGLTAHRIDFALQAAKDKRFDTIQFPLNSLSSDKDLTLIDICKQNDIGLIAMKGLSGGLISNATSAFAFLRQFNNVLPIWGIQHEWELDEFLSFETNPPVLNEELWTAINKDRSELAGSFCRACGYCQPCPAQIPIETAARISLLMARAPYQNFLADEFKAKMERINDCTHCNHCKNHCLYGLDTPTLLQTMLAEYNKFYAEHKS